ncbi:MAG: hypothetical protein AVDCRST_MAG73-2194, partial [uncultured Thermomicrobiales bacterium]
AAGTDGERAGVGRGPGAAGRRGGGSGSAERRGGLGAGAGGRATPRPANLERGGGDPVERDGAGDCPRRRRADPDRGL